jgi:hypothetical protein
VPEVAALIAVPLPFTMPVIVVLSVIAGVLVAFVTEPAKPFAELTETLVTLPPPEALIAFVTNWVVAICVLFVPLEAVGANGVPVKVGLALKTTLPVPVLVVTPVPPFATGNCPLTPVVKGRLVAFARFTENGVPKLGFIKEALLRKTTLPDPVLVVTPVPPLATANVPLKVTSPELAELGVKPVEPPLKEET